MEEFKSGFIGLVGPTNSGKSTLMNALVGEKVSIVSPRAQTTYHGVRGIKNTERSQMIFTDTPGFQRHPEPMARLLNRVADKNAKDCDILVWIFDASNDRVIDQIEKLKDKISTFKPQASTFLVLNKIDKIARISLLPMIEKISAMKLFAEIIPISAKKKDGIDRLMESLKSPLPEGERLFPEDQVTDRPQSFLVSEFVREKIYAATRQEIPYAAWVEIEEWSNEEEPGKKNVPTIRAVIHVDADSKKGILIGKGGEMLKRIGTEARKEIESLLGYQVCLKLHVDVQADWKRDKTLIHRYLELE